MPTNIFGKQTDPLTITGLLDGFAVLFPIFTIILFATLTIACYTGFVTRHFHLRARLSITNSFALVWLCTAFYHSIYGTSAITDWIFRWTGQFCCVLTVLNHLELLKSFLEIGSYMKLRNVNALMIGIAIVYVLTSLPLFLFLPTLNQVPSPFVASLYSNCETLLIVTCMLVDTWYFIHFNQLLEKFITKKTIRTNYTPIQAKNIRWITIVCNSLPWVSCGIYMVNSQSSYSDHCWMNITSCFGVLKLASLPLIFKIIGRMKPIAKTAIDFHIPPVDTIQMGETISVVDIKLIHVFKAEQEIGILDSPVGTRHNSFNENEPQVDWGLKELDSNRGRASPFFSIVSFCAPQSRPSSIVLGLI
jgi:hypothetical protein